MENTTALKPLGRAVLVKEDNAVKSSVIAIPDSVRANMMAVESRAIVVECGPACWPDEPPRAKPGDTVLVAKFAGYIATDPKSGEPYRFINDRDIFAAIKE
jgi:co-chaperonin GroES (HSP10)